MNEKIVARTKKKSREECSWLVFVNVTLVSPSLESAAINWVWEKQKLRLGLGFKTGFKTTFWRSRFWIHSIFTLPRLGLRQKKTLDFLSRPMVCMFHILACHVLWDKHWSWSLLGLKTSKSWSCLGLSLGGLDYNTAGSSACPCMHQFLWQCLELQVISQVFATLSITHPWVLLHTLQYQR